ncbi:hypothetical protein V2J09_023184 [Rumex salicifolius]
MNSEVQSIARAAKEVLVEIVKCTEKLEFFSCTHGRLCSGLRHGRNAAQKLSASFIPKFFSRHGKGHSMIGANEGEGDGDANALIHATNQRSQEGRANITSCHESLMKLAKEGGTREFWVKGGLLYTKGQRVFVPRHEGLRKAMIRERHDMLWAGHPRQKRTRALYVLTCLVCQQDKSKRRLPARLLEPLSISERPWECISMHFINGLPKSEGMGAIMMVVDRFSKYAVFIPTFGGCQTTKVAKLFFKNVVMHWGLPRRIVSDRDSQFTSKLWTDLFNILGIDFHFSTAFHPQTDGQIERINSLPSQQDWAKLIAIAQFSYNLQQSESTGKSPFEIATDRQPLTPHTLPFEEESPSPAVGALVDSWRQQVELARSHLTKAQKRMKKWADT